MVLSGPGEFDYNRSAVAFTSAVPCSPGSARVGGMPLPPRDAPTSMLKDIDDDGSPETLAHLPGAPDTLMPGAIRQLNASAVSTSHAMHGHGLNSHVRAHRPQTSMAWESASAYPVLLPQLPVLEGLLWELKEQMHQSFDVQGRKLDTMAQQLGDLAAFPLAGKHEGPSPQGFASKSETVLASQSESAYGSQPETPRTAVPCSGGVKQDAAARVRLPIDNEMLTESQTLGNIHLPSCAAGRFEPSPRMSARASQAFSFSITMDGWGGGRSTGASMFGADVEEWIDGESAVAFAYRRFSRFIRSSKFDYLMGTFILANTIFIGIQIDQKARALQDGSGESENTKGFMYTETVFALIFLLELLCRLIVFHKRFCCSGWNLFDAVVVLSALLEECIKYGIGGDTIAGKLSLFRLVRVFKLLRTLRIIRVVRAFRELRIVLMSIITCVRQLFWTLCLLFTAIYFVSLIILSELTTASDTPFAASLPGGELRRQYFGNLPRTLLTIFQCTSFGLQWEEMSTSLEHLMDYMSVVWIAYMGFVVFAFSNTVTGIFVDQSIRMSQDDQRNVMLEQAAGQEKMLGYLRQKLLKKAQANQETWINASTFQAALRDDYVRAYFKKADLDVRDLFTFFDLVAGAERKMHMDDIDWFLACSFRLKGVARNVDVMAALYEIKILKAALSQTYGLSAPPPMGAVKSMDADFYFGSMSP
eukprot:TRINITY_DN101365_c0_g1_i1.p1 TRINITY_DN101365_c0_g1~~TRINITY_DN101365_c0_g1_i1.p1  ORF type:complete len:703 (-),score=151.88 TRINITY_DN101365_c0_g1_i1:123-2231(-)